ncbi:hypothetical protein VZT92_005874 [Zoarces viviparus]|uniref:GST N-terminal domain-containing protein n=1 Tax=Zoarces viviparus TaxID=48416 RepID=A0AAW1FMJ8_ZOAVI
MTSENRPQSQDEKTSLIEKDPEQDGHQECGTIAKQIKTYALSLDAQRKVCSVSSMSLPLSEHNELWFMHLYPTGEVPVLVHNEDIICDPPQIMDYLEQSFNDGPPKLIPEEGSTDYLRVQHHRELLDSLQMDAYTHGCILHPEITMDSHIPAYAATCIRTQIGNTQSELKKLEQSCWKLNKQTNPLLKLTMSKVASKVFDHDNMKQLKKLLDELESVMDQVETELLRRVEETPEAGSPGRVVTSSAWPTSLWQSPCTASSSSASPAASGATVTCEPGDIERVVERPAFRRVLGHVFSASLYMKKRLTVSF